MAGAGAHSTWREQETRQDMGGESTQHMAGAGDMAGHGGRAVAWQHMLGVGARSIWREREHGSTWKGRAGRSHF